MTNVIDRPVMTMFGQYLTEAMPWLSLRRIKKDPGTLPESFLASRLFESFLSFFPTRLFDFGSIVDKNTIRELGCLVSSFRNTAQSLQPVRLSGLKYTTCFVCWADLLLVMAHSGATKMELLQAIL